jgi:hypothetical protein
MNGSVVGNDSLVTKEEMVEEDGDLQLCQIIPRAERCTEHERKECAGPWGVILEIKSKIEADKRRSATLLLSRAFQIPPLHQ